MCARYPSVYTVGEYKRVYGQHANDYQLPPRTDSILTKVLVTKSIICSSAASSHTKINRRTLVLVRTNLLLIEIHQFRILQLVCATRTRASQQNRRTTTNEVFQRQTCVYEGTGSDIDDCVETSSVIG